MKFARALVALGVFMCAGAQTTPVTCLSDQKVQAMKSAVRDYMVTLAKLPDSFGLADFVGGVVRLSFHDAATYDKNLNNGGLDGFVDLNDHDNRGLAEIINTLLFLRQPFADTISVADFWVLAANTAVEYTQVNKFGATLKMPFKYGRVDTKNTTAQAAIDAGRLPEDQKGWSHVKTVFGRMGLTPSDAAVLMGAHTLGRAEKKNSGFEGPWTLGTSPQLMDTGYYINLLTTVWVKESADPATGKTPWRFQTPTQAMFLNTDLALIVTNPEDPVCTKVKMSQQFETKCELDTTVTSPGCIPNIETMAKMCQMVQETSFFPAFSAAFQKMQEVGQTNLKSPSATCPGEMNGLTAINGFSDGIANVTSNTTGEVRCIAVDSADKELPSSFDIMMGRAKAPTTEAGDPPLFVKPALFAAPIQKSNGDFLYFDFSSLNKATFTVYCSTWSDLAGSTKSFEDATPSKMKNDAGDGKTAYDDWYAKQNSENETANIAFIVVFVVLAVIGIAWVIRGMCTLKPLDPEQVKKMLDEEKGTEMTESKSSAK